MALGKGGMSGSLEFDGSQQGLLGKLQAKKMISENKMMPGNNTKG